MNYIYKDVKITNHYELKNAIPTLQNLINEYYSNQDERGWFRVLTMFDTINVEIRHFYREQFKHEKEQTDKLQGIISGMKTDFFRYRNELDKKVGRRVVR